MAPPTSVYSLAGYCLGEVWNRPTRALEENSMAADKGERNARSHLAEVDLDVRVLAARLRCAAGDAPTYRLNARPNPTSEA